MGSLRMEAMQTRPMMDGSPQAPGLGVGISRSEVGTRAREGLERPVSLQPLSLQCLLWRAVAGSGGCDGSDGRSVWGPGCPG